MSMRIERTSEKYYYLTGDERSKVGVADPEDENIEWDYFEENSADFTLSSPLKFKINPGIFSGLPGDFQLNACGFILLSEKLRGIIEKYLTQIDNPRWFPAKVTDLDGKVVDYSILYFFNKPDFLDRQNSTFVRGTDHPIKKRYDLEKIGERLIFNHKQLAVSLCVHDVVRKEIKQSGCTGVYCYKVHTGGRLS